MYAFLDLNCTNKALPIVWNRIWPIQQHGFAKIGVEHVGVICTSCALGERILIGTGCNKITFVHPVLS